MNMTSETQRFGSAKHLPMSVRVLANPAALIAQLPRMTMQVTGTAAQAASFFDQSATLDEQVTEMQRIKSKAISTPRMNNNTMQVQQQGSPATFLGELRPDRMGDVQRAADENVDDRIKVRHPRDVHTLVWRPRVGTCTCSCVVLWWRSECIC